MGRTPSLITSAALTYGRYLKLDDLLDLQRPLSERPNLPHEPEVLVVHGDGHGVTLR